MAVQWPASLEQKLNEADFSYEYGSTVVESETEIGLPKTRRRFTKAVDRISCSVLLEKSEKPTFDNFYNTTTNGGQTPFEFEDPFGTGTKEYKFDPAATPQITPVGANTMNLRMRWIEVPT
jgi:hypothetical protein